MSGMGWDDNLKMIVMGEAEYIEYIKIHTQDEPYLNKPIEDYDLLEAICGNDQATGHRSIPSGSRIGAQMDYNTEPEAFPQAQHFDNMSFEEAYGYGDGSPHSQGNISEPVSTTSPLRRKKRKGKHKANDPDDAIRELSTTIKDAFASIRSSQSVSFAVEIQYECMKLTHYGYSIEQTLMVYEHLMANDTHARTFFGMREEFRKVWVKKFFDGVNRDL
ncbi:hypothetical protein IHE45_18G017700 [Dioscorea alata]|uniref:Uncharacterized protein n=1 Tax=Dioscorea alata TaxID=55571 RepID=A0ACB7U5J1_DIOAL|nr:hypothetical protein IHE45_18G017700 [Dioscorea alata]